MSLTRTRNCRSRAPGLPAVWVLWAAFGLPSLACGNPSPNLTWTGSGGSTVTGGASSGGASATGGQTPTGGLPEASSGGAGGAGAGGALQVGGHSSTGGEAASGGAPESSGGTEAGGSPSGGTDGSGGASLDSVAEALDGLLIDAMCDVATKRPLAEGATCPHVNGKKRIEQAVTLGGEAGSRYQVKLRVRGIWEPTSISGFESRGPSSQAFVVGGMVTPGTGSDSDAINYQQFYLEVAEPKQTYWFNHYGTLGHVIHQEDYEVTIEMAGQSTVKVVMNDGNDREIANFVDAKFEDLPPYDQEPTLGQMLHLEVINVTLTP